MGWVFTHLQTKNLIDSKLFLLTSELALNNQPSFPYEVYKYMRVERKVTKLVSYLAVEVKVSYNLSKLISLFYLIHLKISGIYCTEVFKEIC